jgi:pimeloyl-ACP methyl ester carboxylesterase
VADVQARGLRFHVQRVPAAADGAAPTAVHVHGLAVDNLTGMYCTLAAPLAAAGIASVLYDQRGHGLSERPPEGYALADSVADLDALLDALDLADPVHLVGNSYGGAVALAYALAHPTRVSRLVLIEGHLPVPGWGGRMAASLAGLDGDRHVGPLLREVAGIAPGLDTTLRQRAGALTGSTTLVADLAATAPVSDEQLGELACPVLAVYGERSDILGYGQHLAATLPHCELNVLPGSGHFLLASDGPQVGTLIVDWLRAGSAVRSSAR